MNSLLKGINNYALFLLVFSITFENWDPFKLVGSISVTYMASVLYLLSWLPLIRNNFKLQSIKAYAIPLFLFILTGLVSTALHSGYAESIKDAFNYRLVLLIILMLFIANHLYNDQSLIQKVLNTYVASMLLVFILVSTGQGVSYEQGRVLLFGENPNLLGIKAVIAFLVVASQLFDKEFSVKRLIFSIVLSIPLLSLIVLSASRGAFLSVFLGLAVFIFAKKMGFVKKAIIMTLGLISAVYFFIYVMETNESLQRRLTNSIETGDTGRNSLWKAAVEIIQENIVIGVGFPGVLPEMYKYSGRFIDPHNVFLYVLITTGIIGFLFFVSFLWRLFKALFFSFKRTDKSLHLLLFVIVLFNLSKAGGGIGKILFWFLFAILISSTFNHQEFKTSDDSSAKY